MGIEEKLRGAIDVVLEDLVRKGDLPREAVAASAFNVERPKRPSMGSVHQPGPDAGQAGRPPSPRAGGGRWHRPWCARGGDGRGCRRPGFSRAARARSVSGHCGRGAWGRSGIRQGAAASGERVLVEFVSANPTGPCSCRTVAAVSAMRWRAFWRQPGTASPASTTSYGTAAAGPLRSAPHLMRADTRG